MEGFEFNKEALAVQGRSAAFMRWLCATIDRMPCFNPVGLAVAGNCALEKVLAELRYLERAELVRQTGEVNEVSDAWLRSCDPSLLPDVNRLSDDDEPVERVRVYEKTEAWDRSFHPERAATKKTRRRR